MTTNDLSELARALHMTEHTNPERLPTMIRSEYAANVLLSTPHAVASWLKPAPVRAVRRSFFARLFNV